MVKTESRRIRTDLMAHIARVIEERGLRQREAAALFGTTQPRISEIVRGKVDEFTVDSLVNMLAAAGIPATLRASGSRRVAPERLRDPVSDRYRRDIDRTLVVESLRRTPTDRVRALQELQRLADEAHRAPRPGAARS